MGVISFLRGVGNKVLGAVHSAGKFIGQHVAPVVSSIANGVSKAAPYVSAGLAGIGLPEFSAPVAALGRVAGKVKNYSDDFKNKYNG